MKMMERWEDGFGTVELVILTAILIGSTLR